MKIKEEIENLDCATLASLANDFIVLHETSVMPEGMAREWISKVKNEVSSADAMSLLEHLVNREVIKRYIREHLNKPKTISLKESLEKTKAWLDSEEGQRSVDEYLLAEQKREEIVTSQIERFREKCEHRLDEVIERIRKKYESDEYVRKEYKLGFEPREDLYWLILYYAKKYCTECKEEKYLNCFTGEAYYVGSYVIQVMHGQGCVIKLEKIKTEI